MNAAVLIQKKRDGEALSAAEIRWWIEHYVRGDVPDYQMAALAMAIYFQGMTSSETASLTSAMLDSGAVFTWTDSFGPCVDKHSTGGVGDKVSLLLAPLLASVGMAVPMISGRGLGATGGTLDKLEAISGFRTDLSRDEIQRIVGEVGCVITSATGDLVPADRALYALRDVTGTVPSIPLITASIMSKKLAEGLDALVLDVKCGSGAFMKSLPDATALAESLVDTADRMNLPAAAVITDMNQPLGRMAGNAVEVEEAIAALSGEGPRDLHELTLTLGAEALCLAGAAEDRCRARQALQASLDSGAARDKFEAMVQAQGGDLKIPRPIAPATQIVAPCSGYVVAIDTQQLGEAIITLGGGRKKVGEAIDHSVGLEMLVRLGDAVAAGQPLLSIFAPSAQAAAAAAPVERAIHIEDHPLPSPPLVHSWIPSEENR